MDAVKRKGKKPLTDRQRRRIQWRQAKPEDADETYAQEGLGSSHGDYTEDHPVKISREEAEHQAHLEAEQKKKSAEGAARGFKRKNLSADSTEKKQKTDNEVKEVTEESQKQGITYQGNKITIHSTDSVTKTGQTEIVKNADDMIGNAKTVSEILGLDRLKNKAIAQKKEKKKGYVLFVGNLPYDCTEGDICHFFIQAGVVKDVRMLTEKGTNKPRGCAYVEFFDEQAHKDALMLHHALFNGRPINVEFTMPGRKTVGGKREEIIKAKNEQAKRFKMGQEVAVRKNRPVQEGKVKVKAKGEL